LIHNFLGLVFFFVSKQDGLVWGNPVTSVITRPTLKPFSSTHGLTKTTSEFRPNHRETKYKFDKQGGGVQNSYLFTFFYIYIFFNDFFFIFTMQVMNQNMNANHLFVCYVVIPFNLTKFLVQWGVKTRPSSQNTSITHSKVPCYS
jgi:hypothetical protein